jgi:hypothetical protein
MTKENLRALWAAVWAFRAEMEDYFPTPGRDDSLAFAFTESAEAVDAQLRQNPRYKRNNDKAHSIERELTQCAMMLLTSVPRTWNGWGGLDFYDFVATWTVRNIAIRVGRCLEVSSDIEYILGTVQAINTAVDLSVTLPAELARMRAKHKPANGGGAIAYAPKIPTVTVHGKQNYETATYTINEREGLHDEHNVYTCGNGCGLRYLEVPERQALADYEAGAGVE